MKSRLVYSRPEYCHPSNSSAANLSPSNTASHVPIANAAKLKEPFDVKERERKFNVVVSGLPECPDGMPRKIRVSKDEDSLVTAIRVRLGKCKAKAWYASEKFGSVLETVYDWALVTKLIRRASFPHSSYSQY